MRVLVTGATGLVGTALVPVLASAGHEVFAVSRRDEPDQEGTTWLRADLAAPLDPEFLPDRLEAIVHLAQSSRFRDFPDSAADVFAVNVASTAALLDHAVRSGVSRFLYASSGGVYGNGPEPFREDAKLCPPNFYIATKASGEHLVSSYAGLLRASILRFFFVYGPGQSGMLVPNLADRVIAGDEITIQGNPGLRINPIHVDDSVRAIIAVLGHEEGLTVNIGGSEIVDLGGLATLLGKHAGTEPRVRHVRSEAAGDLIGDITRMREVLEVEPRVTLAGGLANVVAERRAARA